MVVFLRALAFSNYRVYVDNEEVFIVFLDCHVMSEMAVDAKNANPHVVNTRLTLLPKPHMLQNVNLLV